MLAIIPARGGSKGIKDKNLQLVGGVSLIGRAISTALNAKTISEVIVTTDSPKIAKEATSYGAKVINRPPAISNDTASSEEAVLHAIDVLENSSSLDKAIVFIQCTSPFLESSDLDAAILKYQNGGIDTTFSAFSSHKLLWTNQESSWKGLNHDETLPRVRRQDSAGTIIENGAFYIVDVKLLKATKNRFGKKNEPFLMPESRSLDIDTESDLHLAQSLNFDHLSQSADFTKVRALVMDFDGVFTDNKVIVNEDGSESVLCSRSDGFGLELIKRTTDIKLLILSKEKNKVALRRAQKLGIECKLSIENKLDVLNAWLAEQKISFSETVFLGNDQNDAECLKACGLGIVVADAHESVIPLADYKLKNRGGNHAIRELTDLLIKNYE